MNWKFWKKHKEQIVITFNDNGGIEINTKFSTNWFKKVAALTDQDKMAYTNALNSLVNPLSFMGHIVNASQLEREVIRAHMQNRVN